MRHRIGSIQTGFGNPSPAILDNVGEINKAFAAAVIQEYLEKYREGCDFKIDKQTRAISAGIEPAYQHDHLIIITIHPDKELSSYEHGFAYGSYGSQLARTIRRYHEYKNNCKFTKFVDKWYLVLFP